MKPHLSLIFCINLSILSFSSFAQTSAFQNEKGEFQMTVYLDEKNPTILEYEVELSKTTEEKNTDELRNLKIVKPGRAVLAIPNEFQYFRVRAVAVLNIRGYWTEFYQIKRFPLLKNKQEIKEVVVPKPITKIIKPDLFFSLKNGKGELEQFLAEPKLRLSSIDDTKAHKIFYRLQNQPWQSSENIVLDFPEDGNYELEYYSVDLLGNKEPSQFHQFIVDRTPPNTRILFSKDGFIGNGETYHSYSSDLILESNDAGSGTESTFYRFVCDANSSKDWNKYESAISVQKLSFSECSNQGFLEYYSRDQVGNIENPNRIRLDLKTNSK
ncbi:LBF_2017 N-terminal domain-containing protein [Leptospira sp. 'Mane']